MAKAKKLVKKGRPRRGSRPASSKRRGAVPTGARKGSQQRARTKRAKPAAKQTRRKQPKNARSRARAEIKGPSIPLRDLVRDGMPRSPKAHHGFSAGLSATGPQARRRMKSAHGLRLHGGGIAQNVPRPLGRLGSMRIAMPKR